MVDTKLVNHLFSNACYISSR